MLKTKDTNPQEIRGVAPYEERLRSSPRYALMEGSMHFAMGSEVFTSLRRIALKLEQLEIPYAVVGGMAVTLHGYIRTTDDVDILVNRNGLMLIHEKLEGLGYVPPFTGSKHLRDAENGVKIEFLVTGDYPGDGKPKPISFPDPADVSVVIDGLRCISLPKLVELKLASGSIPGRRKDLGDVQEIIRYRSLPREFGAQVDPSVREKFDELWLELHPSSD